MRLLVFCLFSLSLFSCRIGQNRIAGNGNLSSQNISTDDFRHINISGPIDVFLAEGPTEVRLEGDNNLLKYVITEVRGNTLRVKIKRGYSLKPRVGLSLYVSAPRFEKLALTGSGNLQSRSLLSSQKFVIDLAGSGDAKLDLDAPVINADITGSGNIDLKGTTRDFNADITGSGEVRAFELLAENSVVELTGSGNAEVFASKKLDAEVFGSGNIRYKGTASVNTSRHGSGSINKAD